MLAGFCVLALGRCTARGVRPKSPLRKTGLLFPPDRCVVNSGEIQIAVVDRSGAEPRSLTLDGHSLEARTARLGWPPAETVKHSVLFAKASLAPGEHRIKVGDEIARMLIKPPNDGQPAPDGWRVYRPHPPPAEPKQPVECTTCHEITESGGAGEAVLGRPQTPDNCFQCHDASNFELDHTHRMESLSACHTCHDPHGGTRRWFLKDSRKKLCRLCHD